MGADYIPYRARRGDKAELGKPYQFGEPTSLIEMPISWSLDDHPHFEFIRTPQTVAPGLQPARAVMQSWLDEFLYMKKTVDWGVLTYTMHPYVIGRGYRMLALEWLVRSARQGGRGVHDDGAGGGGGEAEVVWVSSPRVTSPACGEVDARSASGGASISASISPPQPSPASGASASHPRSDSHFLASFATCSRIGRQVFCSFCTNAVSSAGVMWRTKPPFSASFARISGSSSTTRISSWTLRMIGSGVPFGASRMVQAPTKKLGTVSATVAQVLEPGWPLQ